MLIRDDRLGVTVLGALIGEILSLSEDKLTSDPEESESKKLLNKSKSALIGVQTMSDCQGIIS